MTPSSHMWMLRTTPYPWTSLRVSGDCETLFSGSECSCMSLVFHTLYMHLNQCYHVYLEVESLQYNLEFAAPLYSHDNFLMVSCGGVAVT